MKVNNTSIFMGNDTLCARYEKQQNNNGKTSKKSIDGSSFQAGIDPIAAKKEEARKKAMRIVGNAFENELKIDDDLSARREKIKTLQEEKGEANRAIREIEDNRAALREVYGVDEDSQEEKELKLLEKEASEKMPGSKVSLSLDERKAIKEIKERGLSEYQQRSLDMFESETGYRNTVYEADQKIKTENQIITATNIERLKSHTLIDAQKQADAIMEEASEEIVGMLVDEAKEHMDEEAKEKEEKADEAKEKQEELQERIDALKEKKKENEELTEDILEGVSESTSMETDMNAAQQEIKDMMNKMKLIEDDIKGAAVDENV